MSEFYDRQGNPMDFEQWVGWTERRDMDYKRVAETTVGNTWISTVWIGLNYDWSRKGPPLIFETMIFGGPMNEETWRWSTEAEALAGHEEVVTMVRLARQLMTHGQKKHERDERRHEMRLRLINLNGT